MLKVSPLKDNSAQVFKDMFRAYYDELGCLEDAAHIADEYIIPDLLRGLLKVDLLQADGRAAGFCIYQTDRPGNDWNFREGEGDIREIYIQPAYRGKGYGKFLLFSAEFRLREEGVEKLYTVPDELSAPFFEACGYTRTEDYCAETDGLVYEKTGVNGCGGHKA